MKMILHLHSIYKTYFRVGLMICLFACSCTKLSYDYSMWTEDNLVTIYKIPAPSQVINQDKNTITIKADGFDADDHIYWVKDETNYEEAHIKKVSSSKVILEVDEHFHSDKYELILARGYHYQLLCELSIVVEPFEYVETTPEW